MASRKINSRNLLTIVSVAILVGTEILGAALALGWAMGGLFSLGKTFTWSLIGVCLVLGVWSIVAFLKAAVKVEPIYE